MSIKWITASEIDNWTDREPRRAQELLPKLVNKLLLASCKNIGDHHFQYEKSIQFGGYDGYITADDPSLFYPTGKSVWEFGTDGNSLSKFNEDYKKRTLNPNGIDMSVFTFCFVSSRIWNHRKGIIETTAQRESENKWKGVRIIDANNLESWLETCPSVSAWLSNAMGRDMSGILSLEDYWNNIIAKTEPHLTADFFSSDRKPIVKEVTNFFNNNIYQLLLVADSWMEALLTFAAELISSNDDSFSALFSRCVVVQSPESWENICAHFTDTIIIPTFNPQSIIFRNNNNHILIPISRYDSMNSICKNENKINVEMRSPSTFSKALECLGYDIDAANALTSDLKCSFPALFRKITTEPFLKLPEWAKKDGINNLLPALFAGAWEENYPGDKSIIEQLSGSTYEDYIKSINGFLVGDSAPIRLIDKLYFCVSISEIWDVLWNYISPDIFTCFKKCVLIVFGSIDPTYELPENQWMLAEVLGKKSSYSERLKHGLIISLIMLVEHDSIEMLGGFSSHITEECNTLIREIFKPIDDLQKWRTIIPYIPDFAEVSPDSILSMIEEKMILQDEIFRKLFTPAEDFIFGRTFYIYLLWALEKLTWMSPYARRSVNVLLYFADKEYKYTLSNSPTSTLISIFCLWYPQGVFTVQDRKLLLGDLIEKHHGTARNIVKTLLSRRQPISTDISRFQWRKVDYPQMRVTQGEYIDSCQFLARKFLENITPCFDDWEVVFNEFSPYIFMVDETIEKCKMQSASMGEDDLLKLCALLSQHISDHRKFQGSDWSLEEEIIQKIEGLYEAILPDSPSSFIHYFAYHFSGLHPVPYEKDKADFEIERRQLRDFRVGKLNDMVSRYGMDSVFEISSKVENVPDFSFAVAEVVFKEQFNWAYIRKLRQANMFAAASVVCQLYSKYGLGIFISPEMKDEEIGWVLSCLPLQNDIVNYSEKQSDAAQEVFWKGVKLYGLDFTDKALTEKCIRHLLDNGRPYTLIETLPYTELKDPKAFIEVLRAGLELYPNSEPDGKTLQGTENYNIEKMFGVLYENENDFGLDIAQLELAYLFAFDVEFEPRCLIDQTLSQPTFYLELLMAAYKSDDLADDWNENRQKIARRASDVLRRIHRIPGCTEQKGQPNEEEFFKWVKEINLLAEAEHYTLANKAALGTLLSFAPIGKDGVWPCECVRMLFEKEYSKELMDSFIVGRRNQRGVHNVTGGLEEMELANTYYGYADHLQMQYPITASIVRKIGDEYRLESKMEKAWELKGYY